MFQAYLLTIYSIFIYYNSQIIFINLISLHDIPYIQTKKSFSIGGKCHTNREVIYFSLIKVARSPEVSRDNTKIHATPDQFRATTQFFTQLLRKITREHKYSRHFRTISRDDTKLCATADKSRAIYIIQSL